MHRGTVTVDVFMRAHVCFCNERVGVWVRVLATVSL